MRFQFKTSYNQDIRLFRDKVGAFWYGLLALAVLALPAAALRILCRRDHLGVHLRHRRHLADGAGRLHRPGLAGPCRVPRHRRLRPRLLPEARHALGAVGGAGRADHHGQRPRRRAAGAAHDRHLPRHRHAGLRGDHPGGVQPLGVGDPRLRRHAGGQARHLRRPLRGRPVVLLSLPVLPGAGAVADAQPAALADRPRLDRHPRQRDRRPVDGRQPGDLQVDGLRLLGGADGAGGRAVRPQDRLSGARHLHHPAVDPVPAAGDRGRAGLAARRGVRRHLRGPPAAGHRHPARFDPRQHGRGGVRPPASRRSAWWAS